MTTEQREIVGMVRDFVEREILPVAHDLDHDDTYPDRIVAQMKQLGFFALPSRAYGAPVSTTRPTRWCARRSRGLVSITGIINTHFIVSFLIDNFGTTSRSSAPPRMATANSTAVSR